MGPEPSSDCIVVVDNCGADVHQRLTEIAKRPGSKIRLITVEYDIRDDLPEGTICYRLEGSSGKVIEELLKRKFNTLSSNDIDKIAEFSDGNARVAYALASTTERTGELAQLRDDQLFNRLFVQKHSDNDELLRCAETASLLYSFDWEDVSPGSEMSMLAALAGVEVAKFSRHVEELRRRGLVQQRGKWRAILPHAISNRLAKRAVEALPRQHLIETLVENAPDRVVHSFSRRLGFLHESNAIREIIRDWLKEGNRFGNLVSLNEIGRQVFANIAPVDQESALAALERATLDPSFVSITNRNRGDFIRIARSLAYDSILFDRAVKVLLRFAEVEPKEYNNQPARDVLKSLFHCHLSGTEALSEQRSKVVRGLISQNDENMQQFGLLLLDAGLEAWHFSSVYGFDFGARKRGYGWWPRTPEDVRNWYKPFIDIAVEFGRNNDALGRRARTILGESIRGLWVQAGLKDDIDFAVKELARVDGWPEGWLGIRRILQWDGDKLKDQSLEELRKLEETLAPRDLKAKIHAKVLARGSFGDDVDEVTKDDGTKDYSASFRNSEIEAENLGRAAALQDDLVRELLPDLLVHGQNGKVWHFGFGVGRENRNVGQLLLEAKRRIEFAKLGSFNLIFVRGVVSGWQKTNPQEVAAFLDQAVIDDFWGQWFPELQVRVDLDDIAFSRIIKSIELGNAPSWQYSHLGMGRATDPLSVSQISVLVSGIGSKPDDGLSVAIDVLGMVVHGAAEKSNKYKEELATACISFLRDIDWSKIKNGQVMVDHHINQVLDFTLAASKSFAEVRDILQNLIAFERSSLRSHSYDRGCYLGAFFKIYPKETLDAIYEPDSEGSCQTSLRLFSFLDRGRETGMHRVPVDALIEWCEVSPSDRYLFAAHTCKLFKKESSTDIESNTDLALSEAILSIIENAPNKKEILSVIVDRFHPTSWSGSLSEILKSRLPLLAELNPLGNEDLSLAIAEAEAGLRKRIAIEVAREEAEERARTGSFE